MLADAILAMAIAVMVGAAFAVLGRRGPWPGFAWFLLLLFLFTWTGGVWVGPLGPPLWGVYWVPSLFLGVVIALLLAAATSPRRPPEASADPARLEAEAQRRVAAVVAVDIFFWLVVAVLLLALVVHYIRL